ncbi:MULTISPECIES: NADH-quinone oxidoreductase subunit NuoN [Novosphingobium]|uniref:NADH-quinone oxidoreductase subunit N n=1 Tax=Novosphingobium pentaromativorans US6-1 TaxID=1088721 RepID=G6EIN2_9SPHN|nr:MULTISPECIES: NADH-quinone oxidoreductase subunit NuoN [Novosphingobium]AIT78848.1 NADH-quinone oxidoreductase subunit N [Novosphingobium pentaromativorans US6-1]EHJ58974.1 NADH dehydrogenase I subunit N [Novosphingobium pentaromativorans US6-1]CCA93504.1 NADH dehydrogenase I subunit N [Novosphingobium sp. PP1Y]
MDWSQSLRLIAPEETLSIAGLVLLLIAAWGGDKSSRLISILAVAALAAASFLVAPALCGGAMGPDTSAFFGQFRADAFASYAKILIYISAAASLVIAPKFFDRFDAMRAEYPVLVVFAALGMGIMVSAGDLLTLYIGLEMNSLAAYVLAAFLRTDDRSAESGLKYFVLGSLASGILLFGMSLTYGFTGTTSFSGINAALSSGLSHGALFGIVFMLAGLAFKISAVPFHMWTPDVYEGAPTPVTTFFATAPKVAALGLTMRVMLDAFGEQAAAWQQIVIFISLASIVVGALGAIGQSNIKRLMAYSSINNVGFMLIGLAVATPQGASAMLVYLAIYVAMSLGGFVAILMLKDENGNYVEDIAKLAGLSRTRPALALGLAMIMFSLAGIPPLFGFWGKFVVFQAAVQANLIALAAIGIAASVIGAFYYLKIVKIMYFDEAADVVKGENDIWHKIILVASVVFISPLGYLLTKWLGGLADAAAAALYFSF